jgi:hypothetical protein
LPYKAALLLLALVATCALAVVAQLSPWVLVAVLGCAALLSAAAAFRREQRKVDRILFEELYRVDDQIGTSVDITNNTSGTPVSSLTVQPDRQLPRAS